jgi:hypothetical protein
MVVVVIVVVYIEKLSFEPFVMMIYAQRGTQRVSHNKHDIVNHSIIFAHPPNTD